MKVDKEKIGELIGKYTAFHDLESEAIKALDEARKKANAVMAEMRAYLDEVDAANEKMEGELVRLQKAELERASVKPEPKPEHTCRECRYLQRGTKSGAPQCFCMNIGPEPFVDRNEEDAACEKFEKRDRSQA